jgi:hypothetical protein
MYPVLERLEPTDGTVIRDSLIVVGKASSMHGAVVTTTTTTSNQHLLLPLVVRSAVLLITTVVPMPSNKADAPKTVHLVLQRYHGLRILLNETDWCSVGSTSRATTTNTQQQHSTSLPPAEASSGDSTSVVSPPHCGWLVYVSFAEGATRESVHKAVTTLWNLPFGTWGHWQQQARGEDANSTSGSSSSRPQSLRQLLAQAAQEEEAPYNRLSVVLCPQANLVSQVKRNGKSVQYHGQCEKTVSQELFAYFGHYLQAMILEEQCRLRDRAIPETLVAWKTETNERANQSSEPDLSWLSTPDTDWCTVVVGSFGKRQGLEVFSDMGPFCHTLQI